MRPTRPAPQIRRDKLPTRLNHVIHSSDQFTLPSVRDNMMFAAREALSRFVRNNWQEILRIDREMGLGVDFDTFVVPYMTSLVNDRR